MDAGEIRRGRSRGDGRLNNWNVSNVWYMEAMFFNAHSFNQPLNSWNVSNLKDMENMFQNARSFNQPLHAPWYHEDSESE